MRSALYVSSGPLIWLASLLALRVMGAWRCGEPALVIVVQLVAITGCTVVLYRALSGARLPAGAVSERQRLRHFLAGGGAVIGMGAIGVTTLTAVLAAQCRAGV